MNAPATIAHGTPADLPVRRIASLVLQGDHSALPRVEHQYYEPTDWRDAAEYLADSDDAHEFAHMLAREAAYDEFCRWQGGDYEVRQFADFGNWLAGKAAWNDRYTLAMTGAEMGR